MPLEAPLAPLTDRVAHLNATLGHRPAEEVLAAASDDPLIGPMALVSSFGAESVVLLHLASVAAPGVPVLFLDTEMLFPETLAYQREVAEALDLEVRVIRPDRDQMFLRDPNAMLHRTNPDACCALRKTEPLEAALAGFEAWVTGRKRFQGGQRAALDVFEADGDSRIKINPLAHWSASDIRAYMEQHALPRHPLVAKGFASIGCASCTTRVEDGEDARAGRWRDTDKSECGIHFVDGKMVRVMESKT